MKYYVTIEDGESTPLQEGGYPADSTTAAAPSAEKPTSSTIVRALMVGTTVAMGALLLMTGPSKMTMHKSSIVDGMVVASVATQAESHPRVITGAGYANCGPDCTAQVYDPSRYYCYTDTDNPGKYCWWPEDRLPYGNWVGKGGQSYNDCGSKCTHFFPPTFAF